MDRTTSEIQSLVMGHESSGIVHSVGSAVTKVVRIDSVVVEPGLPRRNCKQCKTEKYNLCPEIKVAANSPRGRGTLARVLRAPEDFVFNVAESVSLQEAVLVEPLSMAIHAARLAQLAPGQDVLIQGSGTIGLLAAAVAKAFGAKCVVVFDINKVKLDLAKALVKGCVTFTPDVTSTPQEEAARLKKEMNLEDGVDVVLECTGIESFVRTGIFTSAAGGTFVQIELGKSDINLPILAMCGKETVIKSSWRHVPEDYEIALELLASGQVSIKPLINRIVPFRDAVGA